MQVDFDGLDVDLQLLQFFKGYLYLFHGSLYVRFQGFFIDVDIEIPIARGAGGYFPQALGENSY